MTNQSADIEASGVTSIMGGERYRPYPAYKDSGVEWLGEIPAHWEVKKLKHLVHISSGFTLPQSFDRYEGKYPVYGSNGRIGYCDRYLIANQAIVIGRVGASGTVNVVPERSWISDNALIVRIVGQTQLLWLRYILQAANLGEHAAKNAQPIITATFVGDQALATPTNSEQRAIAAFLDRETAKIDALVAKKERLIELFQEKRTALISHAVTKGLDPDAPLKDSGVEWLGEIPAHWEVKRLRVMGTLQTGITLGKRYETPDLVTRPYLRVANVQDGYLALDDIAEIELPAKETRRYELRPNDVLLTEGGDFDKLGRGYLWSGQIPSALHQNHIFVVRPNQQVLSSKFLTVLLTSSYGRAYFTATSKQSTNLASTNSKKLASFPIPIPSLTEQRAITAFLDRETAKIDGLVAKVQEAIDRLKELRTALISAAVTGKIDVREAAA